jgi:hypothetical protein
MIVARGLPLPDQAMTELLGARAQRVLERSA